MKRGTAPKPRSAEKKHRRRGSGKSPKPAKPQNGRRPRKPRPPEPRAVGVVGIGASAGGIEALTKLFSAVSRTTGLAFVVIQHLDPSHESMLGEILGRATGMPVHEVRDEMRLSPDTVFVIPPNANLSLSDGVFRLTEYTRVRGWHMPVDAFFQSLAETQGPRAIGVILSGSASDGALGCRAIKAAGGITFVQEESTARFHEMPHAAIAGGWADFVLPPDRIGEELSRLPSHPVLTAPEKSEPEDEAGLGTVLSILRLATGVDFSPYRKTTIRRRIQRRMVLRRLTAIGEYADLLGRDKDEVGALYEDILITVTSFFRDPETYEILKAKVFPRLLKDRAADRPIRIWVPGCSTGEEVYSIAITLFDVMAGAQAVVPVQIFATDISEKAIDRARTGSYPLSIAADVPADVLLRYFVRHESVYQISKSIRDACIFARQDLGADPPFSGLDLISCRNLLIYMEPHLQKRILPLFHYALKPSGYLLLGASETIRNFDDIFRAEDKQHRLFSKKPVSAAHVLDFGTMPRTRAGVPRAAFEPRPEDRKERGLSDLQRRADRTLLGRYSPPSVVVNAAFEIVQFRGDTGAYLTSPSGTPSFNVLKMAREGLLLALKDALEQARKNHDRVRKPGLLVGNASGSRPVDVEVIPLADPGNHYLVVFEDRAVASRKTAASGKRQREASIARLERELTATKEYLQSIIEEQEATNEELTSANEEILSSNEELQSTNEELETAKEELQSTNEELTTVNDELHTRNAELADANNDLTNVFASINIPMILIDATLAIRRFTPLAERLLNVIPGDVARPLRDLKTNIDLPDLPAIVAEVIRSVEGRELEVQDRQGQWYLMRIRPYRTAESRIEGAVIAFLDIDPVKLGLEQVNRARDYAEALVETVAESLLVVDASMRVRTANQPFHRTFDTSPLRIEGKRLDEIPGWNDPRLRALLEPVIQRKETVTDFEWERPAAAGESQRTLLLNSRQIRLPSESEPLVLLAIQDVTARKRSETKLRESESRYRRLFEKAREAILLIDGGTGRVIDANPFFTELLGWPADRVIGKQVASLPGFVHPRTPAGAWDFGGGDRIPPEAEIPLLTADGREVWANRVCSGYDADSHRMVQCNFRDVTTARLLQQELLQAQKLESMGKLAGGIAHDFNNILGILAGYLSALERGPLEGPKAKDAIEAMQTAVDRGAALVRQLLAFARGSGGESRSSVDVNSVIRELREMLEETFPKNIAFETELAADLPRVESDPNQIHQAVLNLCVNARDAMAAGGRLEIRTASSPGDALRARLPAATAPRYASISVHDTGHGMDGDTKRRIFEPFFTTKQKQGGSGLGLAVAYGIVQSHHGFIEVESEVGKGSTFTIHLPAAAGERKGRKAKGGKENAAERKTATSAAKSAAAGGRPAARGGETRTVLLVEDEPLLLDSMRTLVESEGYRVLTASDGIDAIRLYETAEPRVDVVVSDVRLPGLGGWDAFLKIHERDPAARVVLTSGLIDRAEREKWKNAGVRASLQKPFNANEFLRTIRDAAEN